MKEGFTAEEVTKVIEAEGRLPLAKELVKRVRYFTDGVAVGKKKLLQAVFIKKREFFGEKRKSGPRKMKDGEWGELRALRDLQTEPKDE